MTEVCPTCGRGTPRLLTIADVAERYDLSEREFRVEWPLWVQRYGFPFPLTDHPRWSRVQLDAWEAAPRRPRAHAEQARSRSDERAKKTSAEGVRGPNFGFDWNGGKPRWKPSRKWAALGWRPYPLRGENGDYCPRREALIRCRDVRAAVAAWASGERVPDWLLPYAPPSARPSPTVASAYSKAADRRRRLGSRTKAPFLVCRNGGRYRWSPSKTWRGRGWLGVDLRDEFGNWLEEAAAVARANAINDAMWAWWDEGTPVPGDFAAFGPVGPPLRHRNSGDDEGGASRR